MKKKEHIVKTIKPGSIAEELEITPGDKVLAIDNTEIEDILIISF
jgi:C-terminal processing protease CtpA/Prc